MTLESTDPAHQRHIEHRVRAVARAIAMCRTGEDVEPGTKKAAKAEDKYAAEAVEFIVMSNALEQATKEADEILLQEKHGLAGLIFGVGRRDQAE